MVKNTECFNNNPQNRNNNPEDIGFRTAFRIKISVKEQKNYPDNKENNIDSHSL